MISRQLLWFVPFLLIMPTLAMAYGLGVSPTELTICVAPGQIKNASFYVSTTVDVTGTMEAYMNNISWVYVDRFLDAPPAGKLSILNATIYTPNGIDYGVRHGMVQVCIHQTSVSGMMVIPCVDVKLDVDVQETCPDIEQAKNYYKNLIKDVLSVMILILIIILALRQVNRTKKIRKAPESSRKRKK